MAGLHTTYTLSPSEKTTVIEAIRQQEQALVETIKAATAALEQIGSSTDLAAALEEFARSRDRAIARLQSAADVVRGGLRKLADEVQGIAEGLRADLFAPAQAQTNKEEKPAPAPAPQRQPEAEQQEKKEEPAAITPSPEAVKVVQRELAAWSTGEGIVDETRTLPLPPRAALEDEADQPAPPAPSPAAPPAPDTPKPSRNGRRAAART